MRRYVLIRALSIVPTLVGVSVAVFLMIRLIPGTIVEQMIGTEGTYSEQSMRALRAFFGLDQPLHVQYLRFVGNALLGDLGNSIIQKAPVGTIIAERLGPTAFLLVLSSLISLIIAVPLALVAAARHDTVSDHSIRLAGMIGFAMPPFWIGILLILLFGLYLDWFPISGFGKGFFAHIWHLTLPSVTIALSRLAPHAPRPSSDPHHTTGQSDDMDPILVSDMSLRDAGAAAKAPGALRAFQRVTHGPSAEWRLIKPLARSQGVQLYAHRPHVRFGVTAGRHTCHGYSSASTAAAE